jgi:phage terminase large subunit
VSEVILALPVDDPLQEHQGFNIIAASQEIQRKRLEHWASLDTPAKRKFELEVCARDVVYWCQQWVWTSDPRDRQVYPLWPWPRQEQFLRWLQERKRRQERGVAKKSRDCGVSYLCAADAVHDWLFVPHFVAGFGSRKLEYVDRLGDLKSIIEKCRFVLYNLPDWMLPEGYDRRKHDNHCRILNPQMESAIVGEGGDEIGRGDRTSVYFVDEAAFLSHPEMAEGALSATTNVRIDVSTSNGPDTEFARKWNSLPENRKFFFSYHDDPRKNEAWKTRTLLDIGPVRFAGEYEGDDSAAVEGLCIPYAWVMAAVDLALNIPASPEHNRSGADIAEEGNDETCYGNRRGSTLWRMWFGPKQDTTQTAWMLADQTEKDCAVSLNYDVMPSGIKGTYAAAERDPTNGSRKIKFQANPINFGSTPTDARWSDGRTSKEMFANLSAEMWWGLRVRFEKAYEYVTQQIPHLHDEMISIPRDNTLISQLSNRKVFTTPGGKIAMESKDDMKKRGVRSPDRADMLALCFHEVKRRPVFVA